MEAAQNFAALVGRICLSVIFLSAGIDKITHFSTTLSYMTAKGLPFTEVLLVIAILIEVIAGLMLLIGWRTRSAAAVILIFVVIVTLVFHAFRATPPAEVTRQSINF